MESPSFVEGKKDFPFIAVSPQCPLKQYWDTEVLNALLTRIESKIGSIETGFI